MLRLSVDQLDGHHCSADTGLMLALSIRQRYAELILRGVKTVEYRSRPTRKIGERFAIYAARTWAGFPGDATPGTGAGQFSTGCPPTGKATIRA